MQVWNGEGEHAAAGGASGSASTLSAVAQHYKKVLRSCEHEYEKRAKAGKPSAEDGALERVIFGLVACFVNHLDGPLLVGFRTLVPQVFDVYLRQASRPRAQLCEMLLAAGFDPTLVRRIGEEDALVRQPFFWSQAGMKLFGDHPDLKSSRSLRALISEALEQEAMIVASFIELLLGRRESGSIDDAELGRMLQARGGEL